MSTTVNPSTVNNIPVETFTSFLYSWPASATVKKITHKIRPKTLITIFVVIYSASRFACNYYPASTHAAKCGCLLQRVVFIDIRFNSDSLNFVIFCFRSNFRAKNRIRLSQVHRHPVPRDGVSRTRSSFTLGFEAERLSHHADTPFSVRFVRRTRLNNDRFEKYTSSIYTKRNPFRSHKGSRARSSRKSIIIGTMAL